MKIVKSSGLTGNAKAYSIYPFANEDAVIHKNISTPFIHVLAPIFGIKTASIFTHLDESLCNTDDINKLIIALQKAKEIALKLEGDNNA